MALFALIFFIAFIVNAHTKSQTLDEHIEEDLSRMARYELIHFDLTQFESNRIISFDAFNEHYLVELEINPHIIMSEIRHFGDDDTLYNPRNLTTSCHYQGRVLNMSYSAAALSMCRGRGIRGFIRLPNDELEINPSRYWFDREFDRTQDHEIYDEHLVYRASDFHTTASVYDSYHHMHMHRDMHQDISRRRRLASTNKVVKLYILSGVSYTKYAGSAAKAQAHAADITNRLTALYKNGNWGSLGTIKFQLIGFNAAPSWTGGYQVAKRNNDGNKWLTGFGTFLKSNVNGYNAAHLITRKAYTNGPPNWQDVAGYAPVGTMCKWTSVETRGISKGTYAGLADIASVMAHEIGHNFGISHDTAACGSGKIMWYQTGGETPFTDWSGCSENQLVRHCSGAKQCACLGGASATSSGTSSCISISGLSSSFSVYNGVWKSSGSNYVKGGYKLVRMTTNAGATWTFSSTWSPNGWGGGWCNSNSVTGCRQWNTNSGAQSVSIKTSSSCTSSGGGSTSGTCLKVTGLWAAVNGAYKKTGSYYKRGGYYIWRKTDANPASWTMQTSKTFQDWNLGWCHQTNIASCSKIWTTPYGTWTPSRFVVGNCGSFEEEDEPECLEEEDVSYAERICVFNNGTQREFRLSHEQCVNQKALYYQDMEINGSIAASYLHWKPNMDEGPLTSNGSWIIAKNNIGSDAHGEAWCDGHVLGEDCGENMWMIEASGGDTIAFVKDETMYVANHACGASDGSARSDAKSTIVAIVIGVVVAIVIISVMIWFVFHKKAKGKKVMVQVPDEDEMELEVEVDEENGTMTEL
eukprot:92372_1